MLIGDMSAGKSAVFFAPASRWVNVPLFARFFGEQRPAALH